jgi:hypothetical protein
MGDHPLPVAPVTNQVWTPTLAVLNGSPHSKSSTAGRRRDDEPTDDMRRDYQPTFDICQTTFAVLGLRSVASLVLPITLRIPGPKEAGMVTATGTVAPDEGAYPSTIAT